MSIWNTDEEGGQGRDIGLYDIMAWLNSFQIGRYINSVENGQTITICIKLKVCGAQACYWRVMWINANRETCYYFNLFLFFAV